MSVWDKSDFMIFCQVVGDHTTSYASANLERLYRITSKVLRIHSIRALFFRVQPDISSFVYTLRTIQQSMNRLIEQSEALEIR